MKNKSETIRKIVSYINNEDEEGGFWLPHIQRHFVWKEEQIYRLFDSILREYPINTLLVWKTKTNMRRRGFIQEWQKDNSNFKDFITDKNDKKKSLVLDGQQRLQSLFIGLKGAYSSKILYIDILSGEATAPDDIKYKFRFLGEAEVLSKNKKDSGVLWIKFKDLVEDGSSLRSRNRIKKEAKRELQDQEIEKIDKNLELIRSTFMQNETISYQELDSIDNPDIYSDDDVVEVFIRANSGGTQLNKSDLLFSLLAASWDEVHEAMDKLLEKLNKNGFEFERDFILKTFLVLLGLKAQYRIKKFREDGVRERIRQEWDGVSKSIKAVEDYLTEKTYIRSKKALPSNLVLIPLIFLHYKYPDAWKLAKDKDKYLIRCLLTNVFGQATDTLLDALTDVIDTQKDFTIGEIYGVITSNNRSLTLTEDNFFEISYGDNRIHLLFNLWYGDFKYQPAYNNNLPEIDHIFPQDALKAKHEKEEQNQLANCMLLKKEENGPGGKGDQLPSKWFADKCEKYLERHLIPKEPALWELDRFEDFIKERKRLIKNKFGYLLAKDS